MDKQNQKPKILHHSRLSVHRVSHNETDFDQYDIDVDMDADVDDEMSREISIGDDDGEFLDALMDLEIPNHIDDIVHDMDEAHLNVSTATHSDELEFDVEADWDGRSCSISSSFYRYSSSLEPQDIVCGRGMYRSTDHPGNIHMQTIVKPYLVRYGKATEEDERSTIVGEIQTILTDTNENTRRAPRFLFPGLSDEGNIFCREATSEEIVAEINDAIRSHFNLIPTTNDAIFGRGKPIRDHLGNQRLRTFIEPLRHQYSTSRDRQGLVQVARDTVSNAGGRFLLPYNKSQPSNGCILADEESIRKKIAHLYREKRKMGNCDIPIVQAHHADDFPPGPVVHYLSTTLSPKSITSSTSSSITDTDDQDTTHSEKPPHMIKIDNGPAVSSTLDVVGERSQRSMSSKSFQCSSNVSKISCSKRSMLILVITSVAVVAAVVVAIQLSKKDDSNSNSAKKLEFLYETSLTLRTILQRGYLTCGTTNQEGYSAQDPSTRQWKGFEVDLCRAVAASIFGKDKFATRDDPLATRSSEPVKYEILKASERFVALSSQRVDLLLAVTTQNMERNIYEVSKVPTGRAGRGSEPRLTTCLHLPIQPSTQKGYTFSTPYLVNGLIFAGHPDNLGCMTDLNSTTPELGQCADARFCVLNGTTHKDLILKKFPGLQGRISSASTLDYFYEFFIEKGCEILAGEQFDLAPSQLTRRGYTGPYEMGGEILSRELISMVTRDGDAKFSDFCNWVVQALLSAEEMRIMSAVEVSPLDLQKTLIFGERYETMFQDAFEVVGDYGQLYSEHLESFVPRSDANMINLGNQPGMYAIEFGKIETDQPPRMTNSSKIQEIKERGHLNCGITHTPIFAELNEEGEWVGLDIDFCKAISAALFDGKVEVRYQRLDPSIRFEALQKGQVDVLARVTTITMERDVKEPTTGAGFSFSYPNFRDRIRYAGIEK